MAQQPAANPAYYAQPPPAYVEGSKPIYPSAPTNPQYPPYQPAPMYPPQHQTVPDTVVIQQQPQSVTVIQAIQYGEDPMVVQCPFCNQTVTTQITYSFGGLVWLICVLMSIFGFFVCAWLPCCIKKCQDVTHRCPNCHKTLGHFKRL